MARLVFDASALLAVLGQEPGDEQWAGRLADGCISAVNLSEVVARLADLGMPESEIRRALEPLGLDVVPFDAAQAWATGMPRPATRAAGLSLGDRACLALGRQTRLPVVTADRTWKTIRTGVKVRLVHEDHDA